MSGMDKKTVVARQFDGLAARIVDLPCNSPVKVGIDGITASGKTMLADILALRVRALGRPVVRATIDGFHNPPDIRYQQGKDSPEGYFEDSFNYADLGRKLLGPLSAFDGQGLTLPTAVYDFRTNSDVTDEHAIFEADTILIFDGVMLFRQDIDPYWDYRIYVDARFQTGFVRGVPRDASSDEDQMEIGKKYLSRYFPGQRIYQAAAHPLERADLIVFNDDPKACVFKYSAP